MQIVEAGLNDLGRKLWDQPCLTCDGTGLLDIVSAPDDIETVKCPDCSTMQYESDDNG